MKSFNELINSGKPVVVDFFADWCGPCKAMVPILNDVKATVKESAIIIKIDVDKAQSLASEYGIRAIPTLLIIKDGKEVWRHSGVCQPEVLKKKIMNLV
ncbi:MAG: thioredoxin [Chitinophagaceae bacterium]|nr:thioredoxin [Chitinophagaceae bacterium]